MRQLNALLEILFNQTLLSLLGLKFILTPRLVWSDIRRLYSETKSVSDGKKIRFIFKSDKKLQQKFFLKHNPGYNLILHGSRADGTANAFSDYDDLVILKKSFFTDFLIFKQTVRDLRQLALTFARLDPLSHHGHWFVSEKGLECYNTSVLPLEALKNSASLTGKISLDFKVSQKNANLKEVYLENCRSMISLVKLGSETNLINLYQLKTLVSDILILAPLRLQLMGRKTNKRQALTKYKNKLPTDLQKLITWASSIRSNWSAYQPNRLWQWPARWLPDRGLIETYAKRFSPIISWSELPIFPFRISRLTKTLKI